MDLDVKKPVLAIDPGTKQRQKTASDPALSAWVGANAGSGKTFVLARRVIRLLLQGADPSRILCLTFTKAAAAEMSERVFNALSEWTTLDHSSLSATLEGYLSRPPQAHDIVEARRLFARALETPGGLKIQTIHAFCERLLHQFPVEANVAGHFEVLDDNGKAELIHEARAETLLAGEREPESELAQVLNLALSTSGDMAISSALDQILLQRTNISKWIEAKGGLPGALQDLTRFLGLNADETAPSLKDQITASPHFTKDHFGFLASEFEASSTRYEKRAPLAKRLSGLSDEDALREAHIEFFLKKDGTGLSKAFFAPKSVFASDPSLETRMLREQDRLIDLLDKEKALNAIEATTALFTIGMAITERYERKKRDRGLMDFDDLIEKAASLLEQPDAAAWVHYKLDGGLDHILVDEAQDTSPRQWDIVRYLADEFYAGKSARELRRTLFAVGDEKQSIYSFQGASPEWFSRMRRYFGKAAENAGEPFKSLPLSLSFRSTGDVLGAVDCVFETDNLNARLTDDDYTPHQAARLNQLGMVEIWPIFGEPETPEHEGDWWQPLDLLSNQSAKVQLADAVAVKIANLLENGERLEGTGRKIRAGDILVLARKRGGQVDAINRALKARGLPVAGSDRLQLSDSIAILDLLALADFVLLSEDDVALAGLLKSPLIGMSEDDLFTLAHGRKGTLWRALYEKAMSGTMPFVEAYERLERWRSEADFTPPFDFFLNALARDGGRSRFLARLGAETDDVIDAFLNEVRAYEDRHIPSLQGFVHWFRSGSTTIKRDMEGAGEDIRVMTVHGSKGLEAPIVFLVDGGRPYHASHQPDLVVLSEKGPPYLWKRRKDDAPRAQAAALARAEDAALSEYYRLLYVAMTRARDRLYVAATGNSKGEADRNGWYSKISDALLASPHTKEIKDATGNAIAWRFRSSDAAPVPPQEIETSVQPHLEIPAFLFEKAEPAPEPVRRLTPSESEIEDLPELNDETGDHNLPGLAATDRGVLMHTLLERLPELSEDQRRSAAERYLNDQAPTTLAKTKDRMIDEVINILENPRTASIFQEIGSRAEVSISGRLVLNGQSVDINAVIDRMIVSTDTVHIVDFKTNRSVPSRLKDVPSAYTRQLAIYRALVRSLYPDHSVTASLLWTRTADLMTLDDAALDAAISAI